MQVNVLHNKKDIDYTRLWTGDKSQRVCFMLPGIGYSVDRPLLYYSTQLLLENEFEVVQTNYSYSSGITTYEELRQTVINNVKPILLETLQNNSYKEIVILGKSIGTVPIVEEFIHMRELESSKVVLLTPLLDNESSVNNLTKLRQKALVVIGDKDRHFCQDKIAMLKEKTPTAEFVVIKGANHSLEIESANTFKNIEILRFVLERIENLINL